LTGGDFLSPSEQSGEPKKYKEKKFSDEPTRASIALVRSWFKVDYFPERFTAMKFPFSENNKYKLDFGL